MSTFPTRAELGTRINVTGTSGSGKSTFAAALAQRLGSPCIEQDALFWGPDWAESPDAVFLPRLAEATAGEFWVVDGNYTRGRPLYWPRLHTVIFLDYPRWLVMWRVVTRTMRRTLRRESLWQGNRERLGNALFSRDSIIRWSWNTYHHRRAQFARVEADPAHAHIRFVRFQSPHQAQRWLESL